MKFYFLGNLDLLGMMNNRDRTELRLLLHQHKLLFLRPKYREEHLIEEDKGLLQFCFFLCALQFTKNQFRFGAERNLSLNKRSMQ